MSSVKTRLSACRAAVLVEGVKARQRGGQHSRSESRRLREEEVLCEGGIPGSMWSGNGMQRGDRTVRVLTVEPVSLLLAAGD